MGYLNKALVCSLLLWLLASQSTDNVYSLNGQTYTYIYGQGSGANNGDSRTQADSQTFVPDSTYVPPATAPIPTIINCPRNQVYDNVLCECVCILGYYMSGGVCYPNVGDSPVCGRNQVYRDKRCNCADGFYLIGGICDVCPPYSTYILSTLSCQCAQGYIFIQGECRTIYTPPVTPTPVTPTCGINEQLVNGICTCLPDFYLIKGACTYCAAPNYYDARLAICRPVCTSNQQLDLASLKCVCIGGFNNIDGQCGVCPAYSVYSPQTGKCVCIEGYTFSSGLCIPKTTPPLPPTPLPNPPRPCSDPNAYLLDGFCVCKQGYFPLGGVCSVCPPNTFFDANLQVCRIACNANEIYNVLSGLCVCSPNFFRINGTCSTCPGNSTYNSVLGTCECPEGFRQSAGGFCVIGCGVNEILQNGKCCCKAGYYPVNGICGQCAWNEVYDQGLGICRRPCDPMRIYDISVRRCVCLPHYYEMADGTCDTCPLYSVYDQITKTCVCQAGYIKNLGLCTASCNAYERYVNGSCICKEGYYLIGYSCGLCPPTQVYDATYRICHSPCKTNEVWDPVIRSCRCLPGYYLINGICGQCDTRTQVYSQKSQCCECIEGYKKESGQGCNGVCSPICSVNEDWILNRCVCKPGYYLINNYCTKCPDGQFYDVYQRICRVQCGTNQVYNFNSGKCDCAQGFYLVQGICSKCQPGQTYNEYSMTCTITPCQGANEYYSDITKTCICRPEYVRIRGVCTNCNPGYYYDSYSDRCLCKPGYIEKNGFCNPVCPSDQSYVNGKCICENGLPIYNGQCVKPRICPPNSSPDYKTGCCVCNAGYKVIGGRCSSYEYCGVNGYLRYGQCYCNQGYFWILGACRKCGDNEAFNGLSCECYLGFIRNSQGNCVISTTRPTCYLNERYDDVLKACVCVSGTQYLRGKCISIPTCPANSFYNSIACVCNNGYGLSNGNCVPTNTAVPTCPLNAYFNGVSCTCNSGFFQQALNACAPCPQGTTWNGQQCVQNLPPQTCAPGWIFNENINQCEPAAPSCGDNAFFNGATCVCLTGFNLINDKCQRCPDNTTFDGAQCVSRNITNVTVTCPSGQVAVKNQCVCNDGLYLIGGKCLACPPYTRWNGKFCQCGCDTKEWCLGMAFSLWDEATQMCVCQAGYTLVNGVCAQV